MVIKIEFTPLSDWNILPFLNGFKKEKQSDLIRANQIINIYHKSDKNSKSNYTK